MKTHAPIRVVVPLTVTAAVCVATSQASPVIESMAYGMALNDVYGTVRRADEQQQNRFRLGSYYCSQAEEEESQSPRRLDAFLGGDFSWSETEGFPVFNGDVYRPYIGIEYQATDKLVFGGAYTHTVGNYTGTGGFTADATQDGGSFYAWYLFDCGARIGGSLDYTEGETDYVDPNFGIMGASWETFRGGSVSAGYGRTLGTPGEAGGNLFFDLSGSFLFSHREVILNNGGTMTDFDYSDVFFAGRTQVGTQLSSCCSVYGLFNVFTCVASENRNALSYPFNGVGGINTIPQEIGTYGEVGAGVNWCVNEQFNLNLQGTTSVFNDGWSETRGTIFANFRF